MKKGITATSVAIMVLIIMLLVGTITTLSYNSIENAKKTAFSIEISNLQETVDKYVSGSMTGEYPTLGNQYLINLTDVSDSAISQFDKETKNANNEIIVYEIDLGAIGITDNVYGNKKTKMDVYVVSKSTGRVYYLEGVKTKKTTYYTLTDDLLNLDEKKTKIEEQEDKSPYILAGTVVTNTLSNGTEEVYLNNIRATNSSKMFKYEIGIIQEDIAKEYFQNSGKTILGDRIKLDKKAEITLYAESKSGEYDVLYYTNTYGFVKSNAKDVLEKGIKIGETVVGYNLDSNRISCTTSGKENTAPSDKEVDITATDTKQTIYQTEFTTWKYMGISENGEIMIAPDLLSSVAENQKVKLSGKGGYLEGAKEINKVCEKLYSVDKVGTARCINLEDVIQILEYTGPRCSNYGKDKDGPVTIGQIIKKAGVTKLTTTKTPDGRDINTYRVDFYTIPSSSSYVTTDQTRKKLIYSDTSYWLADTFVWMKADFTCAYFYERCVYSNTVNAEFTFGSYGDSYAVSRAIRPIVLLKSQVNITKNTNGTWNIVS